MGAGWCQQRRLSGVMLAGCIMRMPYRENTVRLMDVMLQVFHGVIQIDAVLLEKSVNFHAGAKAKQPAYSRLAQTPAAIPFESGARRGPDRARPHL